MGRLPNRVNCTVDQATQADVSYERFAKLLDQASFDIQRLATLLPCRILIPILYIDQIYPHVVE